MYRDTGATFAYRPVIITFPSGAVFKTGHLKDENAYGKYLGHEYQRMLIEELTQIPNEEMYLKLISSCRTTTDIVPQVFATTNPGGPGHNWVKERFVSITTPATPYRDENGKTRIFIPAKVVDNPTLMEKNPEYIHFLDGLPEQLRRAWRDGDWDIIAGQVFTEWSYDTHVVKPFSIPKEWPVWMAMDWGVNAPTAVGWYTQGYDGRTYLFQELYMTGIQFEQKFKEPLTPRRLAKQILAMTDREYTYCVADPSMWNRTILGETRTKPEGQSLAELMTDAGLKMVMADNDRVNGLARYREALSTAPDGKPWYQVFETCIDTIRTIPVLQYDLTKLEDVDTDLEDHCYDRDRYFFMSRPVKPQEQKKEEISLLRRTYLVKTGKWKGTSENERLEREWNES